MMRGRLPNAPANARHQSLGATCGHCQGEKCTGLTPVGPVHIPSFCRARYAIGPALPHLAAAGPGTAGARLFLDESEHS